MRKFIIGIGLALLTGTTATASDFETATTAVSNMGVGWNLGNTLESFSGEAMPDVEKAETYWGQPVTKPGLMKMMKQAGFGAIRVPVTWEPHMDADGKVDAAWMQRVHEVVDYVIDQGLYCVLNVHHDTGADSEKYKTWLKADMTVYNKQKSRYEDLWKQIATEFRDYGELLLFEGYNEMLDSYNSWCFASFATPSKYDATVATSAYNAINSYAQSFVNVVRATGGNNSKRNLVVNTYGSCSGAGSWSTHLKEPLQKMLLPKDDAQNHLIFQIHAYPNISNLMSAKKETDDMFTALKTYLIAKGAPVIVGEWGSSDSYADYRDNHANMLSFATYFVQKAKENGMATFYWTGLTDGPMRSMPAFSQPDLAETIVKAYYGDSFTGTYPTTDDYDITYTVNYTDAWQELNLYSDGKLDLSEYTKLRLELESAPPAGTLQVKIYGSTKNPTLPVSTATLTLSLSSANAGATASRITLQYCKSVPYSAKILHAVLIKKDGTELVLTPSVFWGCTMTFDARLRTGISQVYAANAAPDNRFYHLNGQQAPSVRRGIYIHQGHKYIHK